MLMLRFTDTSIEGAKNPVVAASGCEKKAVEMADNFWPTTSEFKVHCRHGW
jgi:hypothetical protein